MEIDTSSGLKIMGQKMNFPLEHRTNKKLEQNK